jgi:hypothetical protein
MTLEEFRRSDNFVRGCCRKLAQHRRKGVLRASCKIPEEEPQASARSLALLLLPYPALGMCRLQDCTSVCVYVRPIPVIRHSTVSDRRTKEIPTGGIRRMSSPSVNNYVKLPNCRTAGEFAGQHYLSYHIINTNLTRISPLRNARVESLPRF